MVRWLSCFLPTTGSFGRRLNTNEVLEAVSSSSTPTDVRIPTDKKSLYEYIVAVELKPTF